MQSVWLLIIRGKYIFFNLFSCQFRNLFSFERIFPFVVNVNVCPVIMVIQEIEMVVDCNNEISVQQVPNVRKMRNVERMIEPEIWNVAQFVRTSIVARMQFVYQTIISVNANARPDHSLVIHII